MSDTTMGLYSMSNPVFECYAFYSIVLILKMITMSFLTVFQRFRKNVFISPEDTVLRNQAEIKYDDPDVERVRRAHLNDLENIPIFLVTGFLLIATDPSKMFAENLFRIYTLARVLHTIVYAVFVLPQPIRAICFMSGVVINIIMAIYVIIKMHQI